MTICDLRILVIPILAALKDINISFWYVLNNLCLQVIPMLPRLLCEQLCSLNPDQDRLTFSVIWQMKQSGEVSCYSAWIVYWLCGALSTDQYL